MKLATLQALRAARAAGRPAVLATWLAAGTQRLFEADHAAGTQRLSDADQAAGTQRLFDADQAAGAQRLSDADHAAVPAELAEAIARVLRSDAAEVVSSAAGEVLLEPSNPPLRLILVGAVHIAHPLAEMARLAGFAVTLVDPRRSFATPERFPGQAMIVAWPDEALRSLAADARTAVVTLTHDPKLDDPALEVALTTPAFYLGCLGSRKTHASRLARLRDAGFDEPTLARLRGPVGLAIHARSPAEIAVSILAEIIATLRTSTPR
jgi:xanthine dehydrogenase accessory factor